MARKAAVPKTQAKAPRGQARKPSNPEGSPMFKLLFYLAILVGVGYAALRIPIGGRTAAAHVSELVEWDKVRVKGAELGHAAVDAISTRAEPVKPVVKPEVKKPAPARAAPAKSPPMKPTRLAAAPPAETITAAEREALERLVAR